MAVGVPIIGSSFENIANQIGYWDQRNRSVIEGNMARRAAAEASRNRYFENIAQLQRLEEAQGHERAFAERARQDALREAAAERARRAFEFDASQSFSREQGNLAMQAEGERNRATMALNEQRQAEADRSNKFSMLQKALEDGQNLSDFDLKGLSPMEIIFLSNTEKAVARTLAEDTAAAEEGLQFLNRSLAAQRRSKALKGSTDEDEQAKIRALPLDQLPQLDDAEINAALKGLKPNNEFFRVARFDPVTQQYVLRNRGAASATARPGPIVETTEVQSIRNAFPRAEAVRDALQSGRISREQAIEILVKAF